MQYYLRKGVFPGGDPRVRCHFFRRGRHFLHAHPQSHRASLGGADWRGVFPGLFAAAGVPQPAAHHGRRRVSVDERGERRT